jgi:hypothetical protein
LQVEEGNVLVFHAYAGDFVGEEAWVPYAADYYFYREAGN